MKPRLTGLWRNPDFLRLWAGETISVFGSLVGRTALPFTAILVLDASPLQVALLMAADIVAGLLFGLLAGVWVDRLPRRPIMIAADIGRAGLLASIPAAYALDALSLEQLYVVAFFMGTLTIFFDVAYLSYLPSLVERGEILEGNSKMAASWSVAEVGAFSSAGWLVQLLTAPVAVLVDAVSFLFSALFVGAIRRPERPPVPEAEREGVRREIAAGVRTIAHDPVLRAVAASDMIAHFSFRMFGAVFLLYVTRGLGFEPGVLGLTFAVGGVSSLVGALFAARAARRFGIGPAMVLGVLMMGGSMLFVPAARDASLLALSFLVAQQALGDGFYTIFDINQVSLRQAITPEAVLGRVNAGIHFGVLAAMLLGALCGGALGEVIGLRATLAVASGFMMIAGAWLMVSPVWAMRRSPAQAAAPAEA
ncbi:MAG: MFS transporter [Dehalococcoidia bacterium]|nr:MFS transporter [Dehalococcoidia bacterium]